MLTGGAVWAAGEGGRRTCTKNTARRADRLRQEGELVEQNTRRQSPGWIQFHFYFYATCHHVRHWSDGTQHILITQFNADLGRNIAEVVGIVNGKGSPAGEFCNVRKQLWSQLLFFGGKVVVVNSDGVNDDVGFLDLK